MREEGLADRIALQAVAEHFLLVLPSLLPLEFGSAAAPMRGLPNVAM